MYLLHRYLKSGSRRGSVRTQLLAPPFGRVRARQCLIPGLLRYTTLAPGRLRFRRCDTGPRCPASHVPFLSPSGACKRGLERWRDRPFARRQTRSQLFRLVLLVIAVVDTRPRRWEGCHEVRTIALDDVQLRDDTRQLRTRDYAAHIGELDLRAKNTLRAPTSLSCCS